MAFGRLSLASLGGIISVRATLHLATTQQLANTKASYSQGVRTVLTGEDNWVGGARRPRLGGTLKLTIAQTLPGTIFDTA